MYLSSLVLVLLGAGLSSGEDGPPEASTALGRISGTWRVSRGGRRFAAFPTIPYAEPPLGLLRFKDPQKYKKKWPSVYNASIPMARCHQPMVAPGVLVDEDCLYLSVFTHDISGRLPVLVLIHGGAFTIGSAADYTPDYMMDEDVVVVMISYRLGVFGFLSFEDSRVPGNQGLKDQAMALRWVQDNIAMFGGDPARVTIEGGSAGGGSVFHHIISPRTNGLFHQAIAESGTSYANWAVAPPGLARSLAQSYMKYLNCPSVLTDALPCALNKKANEIMEAFNEFCQPDVLVPMPPVFERPGKEAFLIGPPSKWHHKNIPLLTGVTSAEGLITSKRYTEPKELEKLNKMFNDTLPIQFGYVASASNPDQVTQSIRQFYFPNVTKIKLDDWVNLTNMYSDGLFIAPVMNGANIHPGDVYFYYFDYVLKELTPSLDDRLLFGAYHASEGAFVWKRSGNGTGTDIISRKEDVDLSKKLVKIIGNFVKSGSPEVEDITPKWKKWTNDSHNYIHINKTKNQAAFNLRQGLAEKRFQFWQNLNYRDNYENDSGNFAPSIVIPNLLLAFMIILIAF